MAFQNEYPLQGKLITIFGGDGFLGHHVVQKLAKERARIRVAVRYPYKANDLRLQGNVGQIVPIYASVADRSTVEAACLGADAIINLVGILCERHHQTFEAIHVTGAATVAETAKKLKVSRLIHISALGTSPHASSRYARSKAQGEQKIRENLEIATIVRPGVLFGHNASFINRLATMAVYAPIIPIFGKGAAKLQPTSAHDVAEAIIQILKTPSSQGKIYELGGETIYTFKELIELILKTIHREKPLLPIPYWIGKTFGYVTSWIAPSLLTADQIKLLQDDTIVSSDTLHFSDLGISPSSLESILLSCLERFKK